MPQSTGSPTSLAANPKAITDVDFVFQPLIPGCKHQAGVISDGPGHVECVQRRESDCEHAPERPVTPCKTPQAWESEEPDFDFSASPGTEEWRITETADGRAVYSAVGGAGAGVTVEFQKWDW